MNQAEFISLVLLLAGASVLAASLIYVVLTIGKFLQGLSALLFKRGRSNR